MEPDLTIVLPAYNEGDGLRAAVECYRRELDAAGITFELLVVDDASTDGTGPLADALASSDPRIRVIHHPQNQGQVAGILNGFRAARGRVVTHNGIDLPFHPGDARRMLDVIDGGADVVVVQRSNRAAYGLGRKVISWCNLALLKLLFRSPFVDHNFVQFYRREVSERLPVCSRGVSTVTPELIFRALRAGYRVAAQPAEYHERRTGQSTIRTGKVLHALRETLRLWWLLNRKQTARRPSNNHLVEVRT